MPIGTSDGEYFDNKFEAMVGPKFDPNLKRIPIVKDPEISPGENPGDYGMVVDPFTMQQNKRMDQIETDPQYGLGLEVGFKRPLGGSTEPAGAFKQEEGTRVAPPNNFDVSAEYETKLSAEDEPRFQEWKKLNAPNDSGFDYDLRGAFKAGVQPDAQTGHWPDTFKKPNHPTFSDQSQYAKDRPDLAGRWQGDTYIPPNEIDWSKMNQPLGELKGTAPEDTPIVHRTPSGITIREGDIDRAINVGMSAGPGTMMGVKSKLFDKNALAQAQIMASNGAHPETIYKQTGTFKGADGRWRQEIDDSAAKFDENWSHRPPVKAPPESKDPFEQVPFNPNEGQVASRLDTVVDHPELFKAYPQLKDVTVRFDPNNPSAHWDRTNNEIVVGEHFRADKGTLYHEIQHAVQDLEGFAKGTFPGKAAQHFKLKFDEAIRPVVDRLKELYKKSETGHLDDLEYAERKHLTHIVERYNAYHKAGNEEAVNYYMKSAGETEARNVDTRVLMNAKSRRNVPPWATQDLPLEQQIVALPTGNMATAYGIYDTKTGQLVGK